MWGATLVLMLMAAAEEPVVVQADWARKGPSIDVSRFVAARVKPSARAGGSAKVKCRVSAEGKAHSCTILEETPAGSGYGQALSELAPHFFFTPKTVDGRAVDDGEITIPMRFGRPPR